MDEPKGQYTGGVLTYFGECPYVKGDILPNPVEDDLEEAPISYLGKAIVTQVTVTESERKVFKVTWTQEF